MISAAATLRRLGVNFALVLHPITRPDLSPCSDRFSVGYCWLTNANQDRSRYQIHIEVLSGLEQAHNGRSVPPRRDAYLEQSLYSLISKHEEPVNMERQGAITFKGNPMTLIGEEVKEGQSAPDCTLHAFEGGMVAITPADLKGKPTLLNVVPSLDTGVCQIQTKQFNEKLAAYGDKVNALTVSMDLPFAQNRFCGAENIENLRSASDYQDRSFGTNWGMLINELKILARGVFVLDADGTVKHAQVVPEVTDEPNYDAALEALSALA